MLLLVYVCPIPTWAAYGPYMPEKYPSSVWYSTGDLIYVYAGIPMDSKATIPTSIDVFKKYHNLDRLLWRDAEIEWWDIYGTFNPDSQHARFLKYWAQHNKRNHATELASKAAKDRGIDFWGIFPIFDGPGGPTSAQTLQGGGPFYVIDRFRKAHPDYAAHDRQGVMSIPGPLEFAYPQVRKEYVRRFSELFGPKGAFRFYNGVQFFTYVENFCPRFHDEYIYSPAVDKEYRRLYGVDPGTDQADVDRYNAIRGSYFTQLLRDIRPVFKKYGKKLAICLDAADPDVPQRWMCAGTPYILASGRMKMEWRKWINEGLVDELCIWMGTADEYRQSLPVVLNAVKGSKVKLSVHMDTIIPDDLKYTLDQGVLPEYDHMLAEGGYMSFHPASDIDSSDDMAILTVINEAIKGTVPIPTMEKIIDLLRHKSPSIRRQTANLIGLCKLQACVPAMENALLTENEDYVRPMYVMNLGFVNSPQSVKAIIDAISKHPGLPMELASVDAFNSMGPERYGDIISAYDNPSPAVRRVVVHEWLRLEQKLPADSKRKYYEMLLRAAKNDPVDDIRWMALSSLERFPNDETCRALYDALDDKKQANQTRAASSLTSMLPGVSDSLRSKTLEKLLKIFNRYDKRSKRTDADWGWNPIGRAITVGCGKSGRNEMIKILNSPNKELAALAWRVLFTKDDGGWDLRSREQVADDYRHYPKSPDFIPLTLEK